MFPQKIISGGQTGVDRAALDVAVELGIPIGGHLPRDGTTKKATFCPKRTPACRKRTPAT